MVSNKSVKITLPVAGIVVLAAVLRLLLLDMKPPHFDEGVNGWFVDQMTRTGYFRYDPGNYHGPLHFYILFLFQTLFGRHAWVLRLPVVLVSIASVYLVTRFDRFLDRRVCWFAALAMAVSPAAVFYGRYAIHESELAFLLLLSAWGLVGLWREGATRYLWATGLGLTGLILTKETYIIHFACFSLAGGCLWLWERWSPSAECLLARQGWGWKDCTAVVGVCLGLIVFFYSGNFLDWKSLKGLYQTFEAWFHTGTEGHGHEKPVYYWVKLLWLYEWPALIGLAWSVRYLWPNTDRVLRFLAIYGCGTLVAYSLVPYKTPWCIITLIWPFFFLFGDLVRELSDRWRPRIVLALSGVLLAASLLVTIRLNFFRYTDEDEPYVYVQTFTDVRKLMDPLLQLVKNDPANYQMLGQIVLSSYYPLPWMLGDFTRIGYYGTDRTPPAEDADFILVEESRAGEVEKLLKEDYFKEPLRLRGSGEPSTLYLKYGKFGSVFPGRAPEFQFHQEP